MQIYKETALVVHQLAVFYKVLRFCASLLGADRIRSYYFDTGEGNGIKIDIANNSTSVIEFSIIYITGDYRRAGYLFLSKYNSQNITRASVKFVIDERTDLPIVYKDGYVYIPCQGWSAIGLIVHSYLSGMPAFSKDAVPTTGQTPVTVL